MDCYLPINETVTSHPVSAVDQPFQAVTSTQTIMWVSAPAAPRQFGAPSEKKLTFFIVDSPELEGLQRLRSFKGWSDNWDAEGGKAPDPAIIDEASKVYSLLSRFRVPQVTLTADGLPMFAYGSPLRGEVVMTGAGKLDYFFAADGAPADEEVDFDGQSLPVELTQYIAATAA